MHNDKKLYLRQIITVFFIAGISCVTSCKKFLAQYSQNQAFVESASDLDELLIGDAYRAGTGPIWETLYLLDDDIEQNPPQTSVNISLLFGVHNWQQNASIQEDGKFNLSYEAEYVDLYKRIATLNTILYNAPLMREKGEPELQLQRISGEAHFLRAFFYLFLMNTYGKPYRTASASTDYGVPLKTAPEVELKYFSRANVQEIYGQIEEDLLKAENELDGLNDTSVIRANQAAVQALLSRIYLYQEKYDKVIEYTNKVLSKKYRIRDMNALAPGNFFVMQASSETIFTFPNYRDNINNYPSGVAAKLMLDLDLAFSPDNYRVSEDLLGTYSVNDLRLQYFFNKTNQGDTVVRKSGDLFDNSTIRVPELYLNKAEALAILSRDAEAIATLQELRRNRFNSQYLTDITLSGADLVQFIRDERRRELCFEQHRWADLRRYGVNSYFPYGKSIRHRNFSYSNGQRDLQGFYELNPYNQDEAAYTMPVPDNEIQFNRGAITNEARPSRALKFY